MRGVYLKLLFMVPMFGLLLNGCISNEKQQIDNTKTTAKEAVIQKEEQLSPEDVQLAQPTEPEVKESKKELKFEPNMKSSKKVVHFPYGSQMCNMCHVDSKNKPDQLTMDLPDLCYQCHDRKPIDGGKFIHGPVGAGACTICHNPHESDNLKLLKMPSVNDLCTSCHEPKRELLKTKSHIHPPVKDSCVNCHSPHTADYKFQLSADPKMDLCVMCHYDKKETVENSKVKHGALNRPNKCQECHDPHGTNTAKMLKADSIMNLCLNCHNKELKTDEDGYTLMNIKKHLDENPDWHGPIQWGDCAMCHNPHGSDNLRMLKKPFPKTFYAKFDKNNYICFECHEPEKITDEFTTTMTNFRNGNKNMHFIHVNKKKGRTCRACHDFHGTKEYPHHLKKKTKFGKINFPIRFIETPTGGSCAPACHARRYYDRENPKVNLK